MVGYAAHGSHCPVAGDCRGVAVSDPAGVPFNGPWAENLGSSRVLGVCGDNPLLPPIFPLDLLFEHPLISVPSDALLTPAPLPCRFTLCAGSMPMLHFTVGSSAFFLGPLGPEEGARPFLAYFS